MDRAPSLPLVVHIIFALGTGGLENGLVNIINRAPKEKYRHAIVCLTQANDFAQRISIPGVPIIELNKKPGNDFGLFYRLWKVIRKLNPAVIHTRNLAALEYQLIAMLMPTVKRVHGEHGRDIYDLDGKNWKYNLLRKAIRPLIQRYIAVSKDLASWLSETLSVSSNRIRQIYNGVDQNIFFPRAGDRPRLAPKHFLTEDCIVIGTVGRLAEVKDQNTLLQSFLLLTNRSSRLRKKLRLIIVGDGPMRGALEESIRQSDMASSIWLTGDRDDVPELLRTIDLFVLPSLGEGISNTILEAMATGLPIVATSVGGNRELVTESVNGHLVPAGRPNVMADTIENMLDHRSDMAEMGLASLAYVRDRFNWEHTVEEYIVVYDELLCDFC